MSVFLANSVKHIIKLSYHFHKMTLTGWLTKILTERVLSLHRCYISLATPYNFVNYTQASSYDAK